MAENNTNGVRAVPEGYHTVTPWIIGHTAGLLDFIKAAFDAEELARMAGDDGLIVHAEARIGDSIVMMFDSQPTWPQTPAFMRLYVDDADAVYHRALQAGATSITAVGEHSFGDRVGRMRDPFGNIWWIQTHVRDVSFEDMAKPTEAQAAVMQEAMTTLDRELSSRK